MKRLGRWEVGPLLLAIAAAAVFYVNPRWVADQQIHLHLWRQGVRNEYVEAGAYRIHFYEAVPPDGSKGIPLVPVHGLGSRGEDWSP